MKFRKITDTELDPKILEQDLEQADQFKKIAVGKRCVYFTGLVHTKYLPLSEIIWAYMRQEDCESKMCCGIIKEFGC